MQKRVKQATGDDGTQSALRVARQAIGDPTFPKPPAEPSADDVSAVMRMLGRRGGLKGGKARADALSARRRKAIARNAATTRWGKKKGAKSD
jgi:hypothetical protein